MATQNMDEPKKIVVLGAGETSLGMIVIPDPNVDTRRDWPYNCLKDSRAGRLPSHDHR